MMLLDETFSLETLPDLVSRIISLMDDTRVIVLEGELGAGKTTLVREFCAQLGIQDAISSPTFSLVNEYHGEGKIIFHIDLYRLKNQEEAYQAGLEECLFSEHICFVEWPRRAPGILPEKKLSISVSVIDDTHRRIRVFSHEN